VSWPLDETNLLALSNGGHHEPGFGEREGRVVVVFEGTLDAVQDYDEWQLVSEKTSVGCHRLAVWTERLGERRSITRIPDPNLAWLVVRIRHADALESDGIGRARRGRENEDHQQRKHDFHRAPLRVPSRANCGQPTV